MLVPKANKGVITFSDPNNPQGEPIFHRELLPSQQQFWNSDKDFRLLSGGFGCGKTEIMLLGVIAENVFQPDNYFLVGRKTYTEIYDVLWKEFLELCPSSWIKDIKKSPHPTVVLNTVVPGKTSTIIFRNIDKMAEEEIKGLNLGGFAVDQAEFMPEAVFQGLTFRLRRQGIKHKVFLTCNPELNWLFKEVKQRNDGYWELVEASSAENYKNLPSDTVDRYEAFKVTDPGYYKQYVLGIWDESLLSENTAFARDHIERLLKMEKKPIKIVEDLHIFQKFVPGHRYQMGVDSAEGLVKGDYSAITIADLTTMEEVASWAGKAPPEATAELAVNFAEMYSNEDHKCLIVPEMNNMGYATVNKIRDLGWQRIFQREDVDKKTGKKTNSLGWRTTSATKPLLISHFRDLLRNADPKVYTKETLQEFRTFIYSQESSDKGIGAQMGYHDDRIISLMLAFWEKRKYTKGSVAYPGAKDAEASSNSIFEIRNGKAIIKAFKPELLIDKDWRLT